MEAPGVTSATRPSALVNARLTKALMRCTLRSHVRLRSTRAILRRWRSTSTRWICRRSSSSKSMSRTVSSVRIRRSSSEERDPCVTCDAVGSMRAADASALGGGGTVHLGVVMPWRRSCGVTRSLPPLSGHSSALRVVRLAACGCALAQVDSSGVARCASNGRGNTDGQDSALCRSPSGTQCLSRFRRKESARIRCLCFNMGPNHRPIVFVNMNCISCVMPALLSEYTLILVHRADGTWND